MRNVMLRSPEINKRRNVSSVLAEADAYIDTIEVLFRFPKTGLTTAIKSIVGDKMHRPRKVRDKDKRFRGLVFAMHQLNEDQFRAVDALCQVHGGILCRVDIAYDFTPIGNITSKQIETLLRTQTVLRRAAVGGMLDDGATTYFIDHTSRGDRGRPDRNVTFYNDKPSKVTGEIDCCHFELRLYTSGAIKREGINSAGDLIEINPKKIFTKNLKLVFYDAEEARRRFIRRTTQEYGKTHKRSYRSKKVAVSMDRYRASAPMRLESIWYRSQCDRAHAYQQYYPSRLRKRSANTLKLPDRLTWGARRIIDL